MSNSKEWETWVTRKHLLLFALELWIDNDSTKQDATGTSITAASKEKLMMTERWLADQLIKEMRTRHPQRVSCQDLADCPWPQTVSKADKEMMEKEGDPMEYICTVLPIPLKWRLPKE
jgi:hypothetical protein